MGSSPAGAIGNYGSDNETRNVTFEAPERNLGGVSHPGVRCKTIGPACLVDGPLVEGTNFERSKPALSVVATEYGYRM